MAIPAVGLPSKVQNWLLDEVRTAAYAERLRLPANSTDLRLRDGSGPTPLRDFSHLDLQNIRVELARYVTARLNIPVWARLCLDCLAGFE